MDETLQATRDVKNLLRLYRIKRKIYEKVAPLRAEISESSEPVGFESRKALKYRRIRRGRRWGKMFGTAWFHLTGEIPEGLENEELLIEFIPLSEGSAVDGTGSPVKGFTSVGGYLDLYGVKFMKAEFDIPAEQRASGKIDVWAEAGNNGIAGKPYPSFFIEAKVVKVNRALKKFYYDFMLVSFLKIGADKERNKKLDAALGKAYSLYRKNLEAAEAPLLEILSEKSGSDVTVAALGHSHLDLAWLWPIRETKRKAGRTFATALNNIEKYPEYIFGASQAQQFEWVKEEYPALYGRIKEAVAKGNIEPLGAMWVEPDINMSGGESIIRQIKYGLEFYQREFGISPDICWLPDVFGFSGALPQILKGCGIEYFLTIKLSWNRFNEFPLTTFRWRGIDGSEVLAHMPPEGNYCSDMTPYSVKKAVSRDKDDLNVVKNIIIPFGPGDGGGGAGEPHMECLIRERSLAGYPKIEPMTSEKFFGELEKVKEKLPVYDGELYLGAHQGTYTSQARQKTYNRLSERLLHKIEFLETAAGVKDTQTETFWKETLLQQFHDILPGTSLKRVYDESEETYKKTISGMNEYIAALLGKLTAKGERFSAINYSPFPVKEWVKSGGFWFYADLKAYTAAAVKAGIPDSSLLSAKKNSISNGILTAVFGRSGEIISLKDGSGKEFSGRGLNVLKFYKDKRMFWNASDMDPFYMKKPRGKAELISRKAYIDGADAVMESEYRYGKTTVKQRAVLSIGKDHILFDTELDFYSRLKMLRAEFYPSVFGENSVSDIQFGNIARSTDKKKFEQFEISAHKFVDVSGREGGGAVLSDSRYGFRAKDGLLSLCLARGTVYPGKKGGFGNHKFRYAFYPHSGNTFEGGVPERSYIFNYPPEILEGKIEISPPATADAKNIVLETIKTGKNGAVLRFYENSGKETDAAITADGKIIECDLLENQIGEIGNKIRFGPYEIKTILIKKV
jgi:Alpha-mannosidase